MPKLVKKALENSFFQTFGAFGITGLNFILSIGYARILGPEVWGDLITSQAQVLIWLAVIDLGLSNALVGALTAAEGKRGELARQGFRARDLLARVTFLRVIGAVLGSIAICLIAYNRAGGGPYLFLSERFLQEIAFIPHLFAFACMQTALAYCQFRGRQPMSVIAMLVGTVITVALPLYFASQGKPIYVLLVSQSWGGFIATGLIVLNFLIWPTRPKSRRSKQKPMDRGSWGLAAWQALFKDAWPYALTFGMAAVWMRVDQIAASKLLGFEAGGHYGLAVRLSAVPILVATSVAFALFPDLQRVGRDAPEKVVVYLGAFSKFLYRYGIIIVALLMLGIALLVYPLVPKFKPALALLPWFLPGVWAFWQHSSIVVGLYGLRKYREVVFSHAIALSVYLMALYPMTMNFGLKGVALTSGLYSITLWISVYQAAKRFGVLPKNFRLYSKYTPEEARLWKSIVARIRRFTRIFS